LTREGTSGEGAAGRGDPAGRVTLSVIVVNYRSAEFTHPCVRSLLEQKFAADDGSEGSVEVLVVDNASGPEEVVRLRELPASVTLLLQHENLGYAGAANVGLAAGRGEYVCVMNPDIEVRPGAIAALLDTLRRDGRFGAAGPRTWMDASATVQHPLNRLPRLGADLRRALAPITRRGVLRESLAGVRYSRHYWEAREPREIEMLSGAFLVVRRRVVEEVGGLDAEFPLYFEDAEWCRRIRRAGHRLVYVPRAEIVHHYNMSAGKDPGAAARKRAESERRYFRKLYGPLGARLHALAAPRLRRRLRLAAEAPPWETVDLGVVDDPPVLVAVEGQGDCLVEMAGTPDFAFAAGTRIEGALFRFPEEIFRKMPRGELFVRFLDAETLAIRGAWRLRTRG